MKDLTIDGLPDEVVAWASTPEGMEIARAAILAEFKEEAERLASLRRGLEQSLRGEGLPLEESRAQAHAELERLIAGHGSTGRDAALLALPKLSALWDTPPEDSAWSDM